MGLDMRRRGRKRADRRRTIVTQGAVVSGAVMTGFLLEFFLDPRSGRRRRHTVRSRATASVRRGERRAMRRARRAESRAVGLARRTWNGRRRSRAALDDVTLAHKVESEIYRRTGIEKGGLSVNAEDGVVFLRGAMERRTDMMRLEMAARDVTGVREVENLLHEPGTPAPAARSKLERERAAAP